MSCKCHSAIGEAEYICLEQGPSLRGLIYSMALVDVGLEQTKPRTTSKITSNFNDVS